jgi:hypothetical protein
MHLGVSDIEVFGGIGRGILLLSLGLAPLGVL